MQPAPQEPGAPWYQRRIAVFGGASVVLAAIIAVVLLLVFSSGSSSKSGPTPAQIAARNAQEQHNRLVAQAEVASTSFLRAWNAHIFSSNANANTEKNAASGGDFAGARNAVQSALDSCHTLESAIGGVSFPSSMDADVRGFIAATNALCGAEAQLVSDADPSHFSSRADAINQAISALNGSEQIISRDLQNVISS
jgi:hypothetical protein